MSPTSKGEQSVLDFAKLLSKKLENYLATGLEPKDIEWVIADAMMEEIRRAGVPSRSNLGPRPWEKKEP